MIYHRPSTDLLSVNASGQLDFISCFGYAGWMVHIDSYRSLCSLYPARLIESKMMRIHQSQVIYRGTIALYPPGGIEFLELMRRLNHHANEAVNQWHGVDGHVVTCRML